MPSSSSRAPRASVENSMRLPTSDRRGFVLTVDRLTRSLNALDTFAPESIPGVEDVPAVLHDEIPIERIVIGEYHHEVGRGEFLGGDFHPLAQGAHVVHN